MSVVFRAKFKYIKAVGHVMLLKNKQTFILTRVVLN